MSGEKWFFAGLASSFIDITPSTDAPSIDAKRKTQIVQQSQKDDPDDQGGSTGDRMSSCKIFQTCSGDASMTVPAEVAPEEALDSVGLRDQVLVFQYRGKFHAVNHECPHRSYPLSKGSIYDIEDFGIVLSAGITCPKHGWAFDLHTGESDKGGYRMKVWDVEVRERAPHERLGADLDNSTADLREVWVRKKRQRIG